MPKLDSLHWEDVWMGCGKSGLALRYGNALGTKVTRSGCAGSYCVEKEQMASKLIFEFSGSH